MGRVLTLSRLAPLLLLVLAANAHAARDCPEPVPLSPGRMEIIGQSGVTRIAVEIADTAPARAVGLMCRPALAADSGMLMVYPSAQIAKIWMKNTRVSLDILFIAADTRIIKIAENVQPEQPARIRSGVPVLQVLELPAGSVARYQIQVGDRARRLD